MFEPPRTGAQAHHIPCFPGNDADRGVQYSRTTPNSSNLLELHAHRNSKVDRLLSHEWFDWTEPSQTTSLQGIQSVQGAICTSSGRFGSEIAPLVLVREGALPQSEVTRQPETRRSVCL